MLQVAETHETINVSHELRPMSNNGGGSFRCDRTGESRKEKRERDRERWSKRTRKRSRSYRWQWTDELDGMMGLPRSRHVFHFLTPFINGNKWWRMVFCIHYTHYANERARVSPHCTFGTFPFTAFFKICFFISYVDIYSTLPVRHLSTYHLFICAFARARMYIPIRIQGSLMCKNIDLCDAVDENGSR